MFGVVKARRSRLDAAAGLSVFSALSRRLEGDFYCLNLREIGVELVAVVRVRNGLIFEDQVGVEFKVILESFEPTICHAVPRLQPGSKWSRSYSSGRSAGCCVSHGVGVRALVR